jgi:hypothetical protein
VEDRKNKTTSKLCGYKDIRETITVENILEKKGVRIIRL